MYEVLGIYALCAADWLQFLASTDLTRPVALYDFASTGAVINSSVISPDSPASLMAPDFGQQVAKWREYFAIPDGSAVSSAQVKWKPNRALFTIWFGISDVGLEALLLEDPVDMIPRIFGAREGSRQSRSLHLKLTRGPLGCRNYERLDQRVVCEWRCAKFSITLFGEAPTLTKSFPARNFLFLTIPPTGRTPALKATTTVNVTDYASTVILYGLPVARFRATRKANAFGTGSFNEALGSFAGTIPLAYPTTHVTTFDTQSVFNDILDAPASHGFSVSTSFCSAYSSTTMNPNVFLPQCGWPLAEYVWYDGSHPSWRVHEILAGKVAQVS